VHFTAFCLGGPFFSGHGVGRKVTSQSRETQRTQKFLGLAVVSRITDKRRAHIRHRLRPVVRLRRLDVCGLVVPDAEGHAPDLPATGRGRQQLLRRDRRRRRWRRGWTLTKRNWERLLCELAYVTYFTVVIYSNKYMPGSQMMEIGTTNGMQFAVGIQYSTVQYNKSLMKNWHNADSQYKMLWWVSWIRALNRINKHPWTRT